VQQSCRMLHRSGIVCPKRSLSTWRTVVYNVLSRISGSGMRISSASQSGGDDFGLTSSRISVPHGSDKLTIEGAQISTTILAFPKIQLVGTISISGFVSCDELVIQPTAFENNRVVVGGIDAQKTFKCDGDCTVKHGVKAKENIDVKGTFQVGETVSCKEFKGSGVMNVGGKFKAETISITLQSGSSTFDEIEGSKVEIQADEELLKEEEERKKSLEGRGALSLVSSFAGRRPGTANILELSADEINISYCNVRTLRGSNIKIGPGCEIQNCEFDGQVERHPDSKIEQLLDLKAAYF
jgi:cytoskeletal protein CcmA (bactofilin family)